MRREWERRNRPEPSLEEISSPENFARMEARLAECRGGHCNGTKQCTKHHIRSRLMGGLK